MDTSGVVSAISSQGYILISLQTFLMASSRGFLGRKTGSVITYMVERNSSWGTIGQDIKNFVDRGTSWNEYRSSY